MGSFRWSAELKKGHLLKFNFWPYRDLLFHFKPRYTNHIIIRGWQAGVVHRRFSLSHYIVFCLSQSSITTMSSRGARGVFIVGNCNRRQGLRAARRSSTEDRFLLTLLQISNQLQSPYKSHNYILQFNPTYLVLSDARKYTSSGASIHEITCLRALLLDSGTPWGSACG